MKKLMIAAAIVCAAAMSQAAAVAWSSANVIYTPTSSTDGTFTSTTAKSAGMDVTAAIKFWAFNSETKDWDAITLTGGDSSSTFTKGNKIKGDATVGYDFLVDGKYKYEITYTGTLAGNVYTMEAGDEFVFSAQTGNYSLLAADAGKWTPQSIPEPTSGLLLLLGVAGLALRRRRA